MSEKVSKKTYREVIERYESKCQHPGCFRRNVEMSHIIFRSQDSSLIDNPDNIVALCPEHHRTGKDAVHRSKWWRKYFLRLLPDKLKEKVSKWDIEYCDNNIKPKI